MKGEDRGRRKGGGDVGRGSRREKGGKTKRGERKRIQNTMEPFPHMDTHSPREFVKTCTL